DRPSKNERRAPASVRAGALSRSVDPSRRMTSVASNARESASRTGDCKRLTPPRGDGRRRNDEDGARRRVEQPLRDAAEQGAGERRMPARADDDHVCVNALRELGEGAGRLSGRAWRCLERGVEALVASRVDLRPDLALEIGLVGEKGGAGAPAAHKVLLALDGEQLRVA